MASEEVVIQGMQLWTTSPFRKDLAGKQVQKRTCFEVIYAGVCCARFPPLCVIFFPKNIHFRVII